MASYKIWELNITSTRGDTGSINIEFVDSEDNPIPTGTFLSGKCDVRKSRNQDPIFTFDTSDSSMILTNGNIELIFATNTAQPGKYYGDIEFVVASDSTTVTPIHIKWKIEDDSTI